MKKFWESFNKVIIKKPEREYISTKHVYNKYIYNLSITVNMQKCVLSQGETSSPSVNEVTVTLCVLCCVLRG